MSFKGEILRTGVMLLLVMLFLIQCTITTSQPDLEATVRTMPVQATASSTFTSPTTIATHTASPTRTYFLTATPTIANDAIATPGVSATASSTTTISPTNVGDAPIVFISYRYGLGQGETSSFRLFTMNLDGVVQTQLTGTDVQSYEPAWSPDCSKVAFIQVTGVEEGIQLAELATIEADGRNLELLTSSPEEESSPAWSPSGEYIAYTSYDGVSTQIFLLSMDTRQQFQLTDEGWNQWPAWSPDGNQIVFVSSRADEESAIYVMNADGTGQTQLLAPYWGSFTLDDPGRFEPKNPAWSPDGNWIAFSVIESPDIGLEYRRIYMMSTDGTNLRSVTNQNPENPYVDTLFYESHPAWSPDGQEILYTRSYETSDGEMVEELCVADVATGDSRCLPGGENSRGWADWCPISRPKK